MQRSHDLVEAIEQEICDAFPNINILIHFEPLEDPSSWLDTDLDRTTYNGEGKSCEK